MTPKRLKRGGSCRAAKSTLTAAGRPPVSLWARVAGRLWHARIIAQSAMTAATRPPISCCCMPGRSSMNRALLSAKPAHQLLAHALVSREPSYSPTPQRQQRQHQRRSNRASGCAARWRAKALGRWHAEEARWRVLHPPCAVDRLACAVRAHNPARSCASLMLVALLAGMLAWAPQGDWRLDLLGVCLECCLPGLRAPSCCVTGPAHPVLAERGLGPSSAPGGPGQSDLCRLCDRALGSSAGHETLQAVGHHSDCTQRRQCATRTWLTFGCNAGATWALRPSARPAAIPFG